MSTTPAPKQAVAEPLQPSVRPGLPAFVSDGWTVTWRNTLRIKRSPDMVTFALLQPIMFVLLFSQVYGGSITVPGARYTDFLMAGIFGQTVLFGSTFSGSSMAQDLKEGLIDRFRTLPMHPAAVLVGRTASDLVLNAISMAIMIATGVLVGWRFTNGWWNFLIGVGLLLMFSYAFSWVMALVGIMVRTPETINNATFVILFPLTFISNAFVESSSLPGALRILAEWNPVSALVQAARELFGNTGSTPVPDTWPLQHPIPTIVAGSFLMLAVFVPLCVTRFARVSSR